MSIRNVSLAAGEEKTINARGDAVKLIEASGPVTIKLERGQGEAYLKPGDTFRLRVGTFNKFTITDSTGALNTIKLEVGFFDHVSATITGDVGIKQAAALAANAYTVDATAVQVATAATGRAFLQFRNRGGTVIYLGAQGVTEGTAFVELQPGEEHREEAAADAPWYAIGNATGGSLVVGEGN